MKTLRTVLAITLIVMALFATSVAAQTGTWVSGIMIQNQSDSAPANITVTFYWAEGTANAGQVAHSFSDTIDAGGSKSYYVPSIAGIPDDFVGSAVVTADQPVAANLNTQLPTGAGSVSGDPNRVGTASGVLDPSDTLYFTQVMKEYYGWNSYIAVQNTSDTQASVTARYYNDADGSEVAAAAETVSISPYTTYIFRQEDNAGLSTNWGGSAVVTGDQPLAGVANFYNAGSSNDTAAFQSYNGFGSGATKLYAPRVVRNYYDYQGGMKVQNVGSAATDITLTVNMGGTNYTVTATGVQPGQAVPYYMPNVTEIGANGSGSAVIESSGQPIVATVNEDNRLGVAIPNHEGRGITYNAILDGEQTDTLLFPQVTARFYSYSGGVQAMNVGTSTANVTLTFSAPGFTDTVVTDTIAPMESKSWFAPDIVPANFNGSVVIVADQSIVGVANMSVRADVVAADGWADNYGDSYLTYNGINK